MGAALCSWRESCSLYRPAQGTQGGMPGWGWEEGAGTEAEVKEEKGEHRQGGVEGNHKK